ncbi:MAG: putative molybdenum carrier protein [Pirellulaceae bacterium]
MIETIISGGQTGVDRAALDVAIYLGIQHSGWCPLGRLAEDGEIPDVYELVETNSRDYSVRTEKNVIDSDATLILFQNELSGGTRLTYRLCRRHHRPVLKFDLTLEADTGVIHEWLKMYDVRRLNIAGPRESNVPGITRRAEALLLEVFDELQIAD